MKNTEYAVIGVWIETDGSKEWDIIHIGPLSYEEALKIATNANKTWKENVSSEYISLPHSEIPVKYTTLHSILKDNISSWDEVNKILQIKA